MDSADINKSPSTPLGGLFADSVRFWEPRRLLYNAVLAAVALIWILVTWPHFRPMFTIQSLLLLLVLGLMANVCYCAAYLIDLPLMLSSFGAMRTGFRWGLWALGTIVAIVLANYWIADEIYPFVR